MARFYRISQALVLLLTTTLLVAQESDSPENQELFLESVDVHLVNVEVFVTDKRGNPVTGLELKDFELFEDNRPVAITNFYAVESGQPTTPIENVGEKSAAQVGPTGRTEYREMPRILETQQLHLVIYIDNFNIQPFNRNRVFSRLREFLNQKVDPGTRIMLISYNRSVDIRQPFTHDPRIVSRALFELEKMSGHATQRQREYRDMRKLIRNSDSVASAVGRVRQYAASVSSDLRFTLSALTEVIDSLAGLPGRKALLYVSDGLPMVPARGLYVAMQRKFEDMSVLSYAREYDATRRFRQLAAKANTGRITFYTVDATGLQAYTSGQAEVGGTSSVDGLDSFVDSVSSDNLQSSVRFLAERTGGSAIVNVNDIGAGLSRVAADFSTYYSLGFPSSHSGDGRYHTIEVKLKQKGYVARHREGYRDKPVSARMEDSTLSSLKYGYQRNPLAVDLLIGQGVPYDGDYYAVPILIKIPLRNIVLIPRETVHEARAKVFLTAMDDSGDVADVQQSTIRIKIPIDELEAAMQQYYSFEARLLMRPGNHKVAVALRDEFGGIYSVITKYVQVGS